MIRQIAIAMFPAVALVFGLALAGCERKEKVLDIETPAGEVEVERTIEPTHDPIVPTPDPTPKVEVDVDTK